jgi:hypothetical protein
MHSADSDALLAVSASVVQLHTIYNDENRSIGIRTH